MKLLIVESPTKAKTIENYLKSDYHVISSKGAIRDLATTGKGGFGVDISDNFKPNYIIIDGKKTVVNDLKKYAKQADEVIIATDPDREGEAIAWHIAEVLGLSVDNNMRVKFQEITKKAILSEINNREKIDKNLVKSQESRRIVDRIIGFSLSGLVKLKLGARSAGRVQSVALKLIVEREKEIEAFIPEEYFDIKLYKPKNSKVKNFNPEKDKYLYRGDYLNKKPIEIKKEDAKIILKEAVNPFAVINIEERISESKPKAPFITSSIQRQSFNRFGYTAKKTMYLLQTLYEGIEINGEMEGLITYIRTDSTRLSKDFIKSAKDYVINNYGNEFLGDYKYIAKEGAQDAHEAIRPTDLLKTPEKVKAFLKKDQYNVYKLIYERALQTVMAPGKTKITDVILSSNGHNFKVQGKRNIFKGCLIFDEIEDIIIPDFKIGDKVDNLIVLDELKETKPRARYTEASLIKELEENGIGRPSTYSTIISAIKTRDYVNVEKRYFIPTDLGKLVSKRLDEFFNPIINVSYTSNLEEDLDKIADGKILREDFLNNFYKKFTNLLDYAKENFKKESPQKVGEKCPDCGSDLIYRYSKYGRFIGCSAFPECKHIKKIVKTNASATRKKYYKKRGNKK